MPFCFSGTGCAVLDMNKYAISIFLLLSFVLPLSAEESNIFQLIEIGQTRDEIKKILNAPDEIKTFVKSGHPIWGPEEEFWDKIPNGAKLEVWRYISEIGHLNLYFLDQDDHLSYKAFAPKGFVYEPNK
jgi:hypothetical protein